MLNWCASQMTTYFRYSKGDFCAAVRHFSVALEYEPINARLLFQRAESYFKLKCWKACIQVRVWFDYAVLYRNGSFSGLSLQHSCSRPNG